MKPSPFCRKRYGKRREIICQRPAGHKGRHARRFTVGDLRRYMKGKRVI